MSEKLRKILVVGGAGYIGSSVVGALEERKLPFTVYDHLLYERQYLKPVDFISGDIRDTEKLAKILPEFSHVIWLAAIVGDTACQVNPSLSVAINQESVKWLADHFDGRIIFMSTCSVYGQYDQIADESSPLNLLSLYAKTKHQAEQYLQGKNHLIFRLGTVYGLSDTHYCRLRMDLVVNFMTASAITKGKLQVFGGEQWRPLVHVKDVAKVIVDNLENDACGIYNLATANSQMKDLAAQVSRITGCDIELVKQKFEDQRSYKASIEKIKKAGFLERLENIRDVEYGITEITNLINSNRIKDIHNDLYFNDRYLANLFKNGKFF
ncbi:MAG: SDR family oxidoreductase [bacterium]|nr:SDR family oxidoreductase [bacterium]